MKKLILSSMLLCTFMLSGCFLFNTTPTNQTKTQTVEVDHEGKVFLKKFNQGQTIIPASNTGYLISKQDRSAQIEAAIKDLDLPPVQNMSFEADKMNFQLMKAIQSIPQSRAAGSSASAVKEGTNDKIKNKDTFYSYTKKKKNGTALEGVNEEIDVWLAKEGTYCYVFVDSNDKLIKNDEDGKAIAETIAAKFDSCYVKETAIIGDPIYTKYHSSYFAPCGDKVCILISDLYGDSNAEDTAENAEHGDVYGYFYSADLFNQTFLNRDDIKQQLGTIKTNACEVFYIDSYFLTKTPNEIYSTLVHEFNHMINFVTKTVKYMTAHPDTNINYMPFCGTWFTEMLAMTTEDMFADFLGLDDEHTPRQRLLYFNLFYNYGFVNWNEYTVAGYEKEKNMYMYVNYANTYAFGAFLARNFGGTKLIKEIAQNEYVDDTAITKAIQKVYGSGYDFEFALENFAWTLITTAKPSTSELFFPAIDLSKISYKYDGETQVIPPQVYTNYQKQVDLGPYAFSLHYVGNNIKSFDVALSTSPAIIYSKLEWY